MEEYLKKYSEEGRCRGTESVIKKENAIYTYPTATLYALPTYVYVELMQSLGCCDVAVQETGGGILFVFYFAAGFE